MISARLYLAHKALSVSTNGKERLRDRRSLFSDS